MKNTESSDRPAASADSPLTVEAQVADIHHTNCAPHAGSAFGTVGRGPDEIESALGVLLTVHGLLGWSNQFPVRRATTLEEVTRLVVETQARVRGELTAPTTETGRRLLLATAFVRLGQARLGVHVASAAGPAASAINLVHSLTSLRSAATVPELVSALPGQLAEMGYDRVLVSQVRQGRWIGMASFVRGDPEQAKTMTKIARETARTIDRALVEYDMLERRQPILVNDAQTNGRVHRELVELTSVRSYAGAPIVVGSSVTALIHADSTESGRTVNAGDSALLGLLGQGFGLALENALLHQRLARISALAGIGAETLLDAGYDSVHDFTFDPREGHRRPQAQGRHEDVLQRMHGLSTRELEVLRHLASGESNTAIALSMGIAETTVKTHIKHVLRKLGVTNRVEAINRYMKAFFSNTHTCNPALAR